MAKENLQEGPEGHVVPREDSPDQHGRPYHILPLRRAAEAPPCNQECVGRGRQGEEGRAAAREACEL